MAVSNYCKVGFLTKPKGLKGALRISFEDFFTDYLLEHELDFIFVNIKGQYAPFFIETIEGLGTHNVSIKFEDVNDVKAAERLHNSSLYVDQDLVDKYMEIEEEEWAYLIGYTVLDGNGEVISKVDGIVYFPQHELLQLKYQNRELLLPIHEDMILHIDEEAKKIQMELPEGILDL